MRKWLLFLLMLMVMSPAYAQETTPEPITTRSAPPSADQFRLVEVASDFANPIYVTGAGDGSGRLFVVEQAGRIWVLQDGVTQSTPFIDLSSVASQDIRSGYSERGLLGLAFHPQFSENGLFYVNYTDYDGNTQVVSYTVSADNPNVADPTSARTLLSVDQPYPNHNGGHLAFGPDGFLYIAMGDGGSRDDPLAAGQNKGVLLGKILRIDVDDADVDRPYGIPEDNPFSVDPEFAPEVFAWGLRNPWRFSFDRATGDLYIADVGQNVWEEVNFQPASASGGINYGWVAYEADEPYIGEAASEVVFPIASYSHAEGGCSVTGGYVYRGTAIPDLQGVYFYGDWCSGQMFAAWRDETGAWQSAQLMSTQFQISSFGQDDDGELYLVAYNGTILRFESPE